LSKIAHPVFVAQSSERIFIQFLSARYRDGGGHGVASVI